MQIKKKKMVGAKMGQVGPSIPSAKTGFSTGSVSANTSSKGIGMVTANTSPMSTGMITAKLRGAKKGVSAAQREPMAKEPKGKVTDPEGFAIDKGDGFERTTSKREAYLARLKKRK